MKLLVLVPKYLFFSLTRGNTTLLHAFNALQELGIMLRCTLLPDLVMFPILASSARSSSGCTLSITFCFGLDCNAGSPRTAFALLQSCCSWSAIFVTSVSKLIEAIGSACLKVERNHFEFWDERGKNDF